MRKLLMASTAALALLAANSADAAQIWVNPADQGHGHVIHIKGKIDKGDANQFANVVGHAGVKPNDATVYLDSPGGVLIEGMPIARAIKKYGWKTYVEKDTVCASMCAVVWLAGKTRFVNETAHLGFHSATDVKHHKGQRDDFGNAMMFNFYRELGVSDKAARVFLAANPDDAIWLDGSLAETLGITASVVENEEPKKAEEPSPKTTANQPGTSAPNLPPELVAPTDKKAESEPVKLADASPTSNLPAKDAGDAGPPPVKPADLAPVRPDDLAPQSEPRQHTQRHERPQHHYRRYAGGGGVRTCSFRIPVPYIGGISIRSRC